MFDLIATIALHSVMFALFALVMKFVFRQRVGWAPLGLGLGASAVYSFAVILSGKLQSKIALLDGFEFNWTGKVVAMCVTLAMMAAVPRATRAEVGLTLRQKAGSLLPSIIVTAVLCAFAWGFLALVGAGNVPTAERLFYQATMPGLDEELFFRGLLLALFLRAFGDHWNLAGASVGPAAIAVSFLFAAGHALRFGNGFDPAFLVFSFILGFGLLWLRQRTGSIALPIVAHNIINFGSSFL